MDVSWTCPPQVCPEVVDRLNWEDGHAYGDAFRVRQDGGRLTVTRIDAKAAEGGGGWGMPLRFRCCVPPHSPAAVAAAAAEEEERRIALGRAEAAVADAAADARGHYWRLGVPVDFSAQEITHAPLPPPLRLSGRIHRLSHHTRVASRRRS